MDRRLDYSLDWSRSHVLRHRKPLSRLAQLSRNFDNNTRGLKGANTEIIWTDQPAGIIVYHDMTQAAPGDDVIVVANLTNNVYPSYNIGFPATGTWYLRFNSAWQAYSSDFGNIGYTTTANRTEHGKPCSGNVGLDAYAVIFYSQ